MKGKKGSKSPRKAKAKSKATVPHTDVVVPFPKDAVRRPPTKTVDASWVRVRLQNGFGAALAVVNSDWNRMWSMAQGLGARKTFAVLTTTTRHVAVNLRYASAIQFDKFSETMQGLDAFVEKVDTYSDVVCRMLPKDVVLASMDILLQKIIRNAT